MLRRSTRLLFIAAAFSALAVVLFVAAVFWSDCPQFWTSLILALFCCFAMRRSRATRLHLFWWNAAAVLGLWALFDLGARLWMGHGIEPIFPRAAIVIRVSQFFDPPVLAGRPAPAAQESLDVPTHGISTARLHAEPAARDAKPEGCVLFFGCSYTFGEGVGDDQTFAFLVEKKTGGRFVSRNFGVSGSAPHYALGQLESGLVEREAHCTPTHAIYLVIPDHLVRVAGKWPTPFGPRYVIQPSGELVRDGSLRRSTTEFLWDIFHYSSTLLVAKLGYGNDAAVDDSDFRLFVALLRTLHRRLLDLYPGIRFDILYWNDDSTTLAPRLREELLHVGVPVHELSVVLPEIRDARSRAYQPGNRHPSAWAHEQIADYIVRNILRYNVIPGLDGRASRPAIITESNQHDHE